MDEAVECAKTIKAGNSIPCNMAPGQLFDPERAELYNVTGRLIIPFGEGIELE